MASFNKNSEKNPHFFKVVLAHALKEQKLEIPKMFVKKHGSTALSKNRTCLKVGDGREWNVGLSKSEGRVWFNDGWKKIVEFYSVRLEYFLVFEYDKNFSNFNVAIFDLTATEIEYPTKQSCVHEVDEETVKMESSFDHSLSQDDKVGEVSFNVQKLMNNDYGERNPTSRAIPGSIEVRNFKGRTRTREEATAFQSMTLNPSFMSNISPSCLYRGRLAIPKRFTEMHLEKSREMNVEVSDGRRWMIGCCVSCSRMSGRRAEFGVGWKKFVHDNHLKVGDACVFQMITKNTSTLSFQVQFFRAF